MFKFVTESGRKQQLFKKDNDRLTIAQLLWKKQVHHTRHDLEGSLDSDKPESQSQDDKNIDLNYQIKAVYKNILWLSKAFSCSEHILDVHSLMW